MRQYILQADDTNSHKRLDLVILQFAQENNLGVSRTAIQNLIKGGKVEINDSCVTRPNYKARLNDEIKLNFAEKKEISIEPENIPLEIVYEDDDVAVINKPSGLVTHPGPGNYQHTLVNALLNKIKNLSEINPHRPGIVHRLDKETSGLMVIAKNNFSHLELAKQFARHTIKRKYVAIVQGRVEFDENIIEVPIGRNPYKRKSMAVGFGKNTKYARTYYRTLKRSDNFSLLELEPFTGRTHQLRVHLAYSGHPVLGDGKYGRENGFCRLALHAKSIGFIHPRTKKNLEFSSRTPEEWTEFLSENKS